MASSLSFRAAVALVVVGMVWGIVMAAGGDHSAAPAHAHLNLLGWVSLFLMGVFYHLHPRIDASRLARIQVWVWIPAVVVQAVGVGMVHGGNPAGEPLAALSSIVLLGDMLLFGYTSSGASRTSRHARLPRPNETWGGSNQTTPPAPQRTSLSGKWPSLWNEREGQVVGNLEPSQRRRDDG